MNINLFKLGFWFNVRAGELTPRIEQSLMAFILILAILFIAFINLKRKKSIYGRSYGKIASFSIVNFFIGLLLLFFTYETTPFLSSRFWFVLWVLEMIIWIVFIFKNFKKIPEKKKRFEKEKEYKKYIP